MTDANTLRYPRFLGVAVGLIACCSTGVSPAQTVAWTRHLGTSSYDASVGISTDGMGNVYITGNTEGSLGGPNAGSLDAFVSKYDAAGALAWTRQLGTGSYDESTGVSADGLGNVYITGYTEGSLGGPNAGSADAFVTKYNAAGTLAWTRKLGSSSYDFSTDVSADGLGNVYVTGYTEGSLGGPNAGSFDAFVSKYDAAGSHAWTRQLGTSSDDESYGVSADGLGNVYITGATTGSLGGPNAGSYDVFVRKYNAAGTLAWTRQLGTGSDDVSYGVSADGLGNVYITGATTGSLGGPNAGGKDGFVSKYDAAGTLAWTRQLGTSSFDESYGVSADGLGNVYISGATNGSLGGPNAGLADAFVSKYTAAGTLAWTRQLSTIYDDAGYGVSADGLGTVHISGKSSRGFVPPVLPSSDAFVAKIIPEPTGVGLAFIAALGVLTLRTKIGPRVGL